MKTTQTLYCNSLTKYVRFKTREVLVGNVGIGGNNPLRIQSMTTTNTMDTIATVQQSINMIRAGCEIVRITAPSKRDAENLKAIKTQLKKHGYFVPLVADIHFTPNAAEIAARIVEKVRVNPGNYADKKKFQIINYTEKSYKEELERIYKRFSPLVKICKSEGTAMRIGTNHGSLSDRILSKYGDTPLGMVESALEFVRICELDNYHNIILSMKASNTNIMIQAYRLLVKMMRIEGMNYPIHLGVTEAGEGEDGRIKSAIGIGTLLEDGIGDTIRVSLTEEPEAEIPVAKSIVQRYINRDSHANIEKVTKNPIKPFSYSKRHTTKILNIGGNSVPVVLANFSLKTNITQASLFSIGYKYSFALDKWSLSDLACDYIYLGNKTINFSPPGNLGLIYNYKTWLNTNQQVNSYPLFQIEEYLSTNKKSKKINFVKIQLKDLTNPVISKIKKDPKLVLIIETSNKHGMAEQRRFFIKLINNECNHPVIISRDYLFDKMDDIRINSSIDFGGLLTDGLGDGVFLKSNKHIATNQINQISFGILQGTRTRISKTEYISCPSCGRTLFDLQETTAKIRAHTNHLKGLKIGVMGCIVNGPGEMADADYGYVGTGKNKISLYKNQKMVKKDIPTEQAIYELIELIKQNGDWMEP